MAMRVNFFDASTSPTGTPVNPGDSATQSIRVGPQVQTNVSPPAFVAGALLPIQGDYDGNIKTNDQELKRDRAALEESRLLAEGTGIVSLNGLRSSAERTNAIDRRGGSGQRGTLR